MKSLRKLTQNPSFLLLNCLNVDTISTKLQFSEGGGYIFMAKKKKGKKISTKMLSAMLPVLILGMAVLGAVSVFSSKQIIDDEIGKEMTLSLENEKTEVESQMQSAASLAKHMAGIVGITYENEELLAYVNFLNTMIYEEDFIYGEEKNCYVGINRSSIIDNVFRTCIGSRKCSSYRYSSISANYRPLMGKYKNRCAVNFDFWQTDFRISIYFSH